MFGFDLDLENTRWWALAAPPLLFALLWYCYWFAVYPLWFEKQIRLGKKWVYVPLFWSKHRFVLVLAIWTLRLVNILSLALAIFLPLFNLLPQDLQIYFAALCLVIALLVDFAWLRIFLPYRYRQQENSYYADLLATFGEVEISGQRVNEQEVRSRVSWEHQSALLKADQNREFLRFLNDRHTRAVQNRAANK